MFTGLGRVRVLPSIAALATAFVVPIAVGTVLQASDVVAAQRGVRTELHGNACLRAAYGALVALDGGIARGDFDPAACRYRSASSIAPAARARASDALVKRISSLADASHLSFDSHPVILDLSDTLAYGLPEVRSHLAEAASARGAVAMAKLQSTALDQLAAARDNIQSTGAPDVRDSGLPRALQAAERAVHAYSTQLDRAETSAPQTFARARLLPTLRPALRAVDALFARTNRALEGELRAQQAVLARRLVAVLCMAAVALTLSIGILATMLRMIEGRDRSELLRLEQEAARLTAEVAQHEAENLLRLNEAQFQAVFAGSPLAIAIVDEDGFILECNEAYFHFVGPASTAAGVRRRLFEPLRIVNEHEWRKLRDAMRSQRSGTYELELALRRSTDLEVWCHTFVSIVHNPDGSASHCAVMMQDTTERKRMERRLQYEATHDGLTGLTNRLHFVAELERHLAHSAGDDARFAVVFVDVDDFKTVNDTLGHAAGDECLRAVAARLSELVREGDTVARFGGDEFAIVLSDPSSVHHVDDIARRIVEAFEKPIEVPDALVKTTVSIGVARDRSAALTCERILADADLAMYRHKTGRGDRSAVIQPLARRFEDGRV